MLLTTSEKAKQLRNMMLDIVHCYINYKEMDEALKLEVAHAMAQGELFSEEEEY